MDMQMFFTVVGVCTVVSWVFKVEAWVEALGDKYGW